MHKLNAVKLHDNRESRPSVRTNIIRPDFHPRREYSTNREAYNWLMDPKSIPLACSPISYIGSRKLLWLSEALNRPLCLHEVQFLVRRDGPLETCVCTGTIFQPVRYLGGVPLETVIRMRRSGRILDYDLNWSGSFYNADSDWKLLPVSGALWSVSHNCRPDEYSNLYRIMMDMKSRTGGAPVYGMTRTEALYRCAIQAEKNRNPVVPRIRLLVAGFRPNGYRKTDLRDH